MKATWLVMGHLLSYLARDFVGEYSRRPPSYELRDAPEVWLFSFRQKAGRPVQRYTFYAPMPPDASRELSILNEKLRALETLMHYERDLAKLKFYKRELDVVGEELHEAEIASYAKKPAKVLPFARKKDRSA
jgi:hypothetical protein